MAAAQPAEQQLPKELVTLADFLLSPASELNIRHGTIQGQRADYFKGKHAENALMRDAYKKKMGKTIPLESRDDCSKYLQDMLRLGMILKVQKEQGSKVMHVSSDRIYANENIYIWVYQGNQLWGRLMGKTQ